MAEQDEYWEHGYRLGDGTEQWEIDHGSDGSWTPHDEERGIQAIDMYLDQQVAAIYKELDRAGVEGHVIRRKVTVTRGEAEVVLRT